MQASRQSHGFLSSLEAIGPTRGAFAAVGTSVARAPRRPKAFTLIELIFVLTIRAICAVFVSAKMGSFFRGRALNFEARRMLSLTHYAQSRAVAEGVPVILWVNPADSSYGATVQSSFNDPEGDTHAIRYSAHGSLTLDIPQRV